MDVLVFVAASLWDLILVDKRFMIMQLASTEEYIDGQFTGNLGEVLIRYFSVLSPSIKLRTAHLDYICWEVVCESGFRK